MIEMLRAGLACRGLSLHCLLAHAVIYRELGLLRASTPADRLAAFLRLDVSEDTSDDAVILRGVRLAAMYRVHGHCCHGQLRCGPAAAEALQGQQRAEAAAAAASQQVQQQQQQQHGVRFPTIWQSPAFPIGTGC